MKQRLILILMTCILTIPALVFAHGTSYLEFNPDNSSWLKISDVATPAQVFFAQNDFLRGVDLWIANPGSSGLATFDLLNDQSIVIRSLTTTIPTIAEISNGTKLHIDFSSQTAVQSNKKYSVRVTSSLPEFRLYYSDRIQRVAHNAPFVSEYVTGVGKLGSEEQGFSFKYALYETTESSLPSVSNINWSVISENQMKLNFNVNEPVDFKIEYGSASPPTGEYTQNTNWTGEYKFCVDGVSMCNLNVSVLSNTTYQYLLTIKDSWGNQSQVIGTFESGQSQTPSPTPLPVSTSSGPTPTATPSSTVSGSPASSPSTTSADNTPPIISNLRIISLTDTSVDIAWTTNEAANSHLLISTPFLITVTDTSDPTMELEHVLKINSGLGPNVSYVATITSIDLGSNESQDSISFTTLPVTTSVNPPSSSPLQQPNQQNQPSQTNQPNQPSQPSQPNQTNQPSQNQLGQVTTSSSGLGGYVQWDKPLGGGASDGYRVDIFDKEGKLEKTIIVPVDSYNAEVSNLKDGEYSVIVYANNNGVFEKIDQPVQLKIGEPPFAKRLLAFWWALAPLLAGLGYILWRNYKSKMLGKIKN